MLHIPPVLLVCASSPPEDPPHHSDEGSAPKTPVLSEETRTRANQVLRTLVESVQQHFRVKNRIHVEEARLWFLSAVGSYGKLFSPKTKRHHRLLHRYLSSQSLPTHLVKEVLQLHSNQALQVLLRRSDFGRLFQEFFRHNRDRCDNWFHHFGYDGRMLYGARAIERFTFNHRNEYWNELVWTRNKVSPIVAAAKQGLYKQLDVYRTVQNLVERVDAFWYSEEFVESLRNEKEGGAILSLDYDYWEGVFSSFLDSGHEEIRDDLIALIDEYLESQSFPDLCRRFLPHLQDREFLNFLQNLHELLSPLSAQFDHRPLGVEESVVDALLALSWDDGESIFILYSLLCYPKATLNALNDEQCMGMIDESANHFHSLLSGSETEKDVSHLFPVYDHGEFISLEPCYSYCMQWRSWHRAHAQEEDYLLRTGALSCLLMHQVRQITAPSSLSEVFRLFSIPSEAVYYDDPFSHMEEPRKKKKRSKSSSLFSAPSSKRFKSSRLSDPFSSQSNHSMGEAEQSKTFSGWKLPSLVGSHSLLHTTVDVPPYVTSCFVKSSMHLRSS